MQNLAVNLESVSKRIHKHTILENIYMEMPAGAIYGIRGHNGAGKSMLLRLISGLIFPSEGIVNVFGQRIGKDCEFPSDIGLLIDTPGFLPNYSGLKNLELLAMIRNKITQNDIKKALIRVGLNPDNRRSVNTYSTGMNQRLGLAQAIMEKPALLILDEPTRGIDPDGVNEIHQLLQELREQGTTILFTSHSQEELQLLCDESFVINQGKLILAT